jgi:hypothetical protein
VTERVTPPTDAASTYPSSERGSGIKQTLLLIRRFARATANASKLLWTLIDFRPRSI